MEDKKQQKFLRGDLVKVGEYGHFTHSNSTAIVLGSYADQYGGANRKDYTLIGLNGNSSSWYDENVLTFVEHVGECRIKEIQDARKEKEAQQSDLDWIIANWNDIKDRPPGASIQALADLINFGSLWGRYGEGIDYHSNYHGILGLFQVALDSGSKEAVLKLAEELKGKIIGAHSNFNT